MGLLSSVIIVIVIVIPVLFGLPAMFFAVPPLVVLFPATLPFGIEIAPAVFGLTAVLAIVLNGTVQSCFRFFDCMLAVGPVIGARLRCRCDEKQERPCYQSRHCCFSNSLNQGFLLSESVAELGRRLANSIDQNMHQNGIAPSWVRTPITWQILWASMCAVRYSSSCIEDQLTCFPKFDFHSLYVASVLWAFRQ